MIKVLFVCLGNICRSPVAEGLLKTYVRKNGLEHQFLIDSAGTSKYHIGEPPDDRTIANAKKNGLELDSKGRQFKKTDMRDFTYIVAMDQANLDCIKQTDHTNEYIDKMYLIRSFDDEEKGADVPDPYFGEKDGFQDVYDILDRSVKSLLDWLIEKHDLTVKA